MKRAFVLIVTASVLTLGGCSKSVAKIDLARLTQAVERFRRSSNAEKPAAAKALRELEILDHDVLVVRDVCAASADATAEALVLKREVELGLAALEHGTLAKESAEAQALPAKVDQAEALLKKGHDLMPMCDEGLRHAKETIAAY